MYKVIELEIDPSMSADTGVFEVAWVEYPAIEQELMYFAKHNFFVAPEYVQQKACQAIKENEKRGNPAGTQVGKVRAQQLCQGENLSLETIKRMKSFLSRAATYDTGNWDDNGTIAMGLWGGKEALTWVDKIIAQEESKQDMGIQDFVDNAGGFSVGDYVSWTYAGRGEGDDRARGQITDLRTQGEVNVPNTDFTLTATEERPVALIETAEKRIVGQYVDNLRKIQKPENFVYPNAGETQNDFIARCVAVVRNEGKTEDQALGQCYGMWENREFSGAKVSFEWRNTLDTPRGIRAFENELSRGSRIYIISDLPRMTDDLVDFSLKYQIPTWRILTEGNVIEKVDKIKELGIQRHYDMDPRVRFMLGDVGMRFDYILDLPVYVNYPSSGDTDAMLVKPILTDEYSCGCSNEFGIQDFSMDIYGYKTKHFDVCPGAVALFEHLQKMTVDEETIGMIRSAAQIADNVFEIEKNVVNGVSTDDSNLTQARILVDDFKDLMEEIDEEVGMVHDVSFMDGHIAIIADYINGYGDVEEDEIAEAFRKLSQYQLFERAPSILQGLTEQQVKRAGFRDGQKLYRYTNFFPGVLDSRDFCMSIEDNFFRRSIIDALRDYNVAFGGPGGQPYSKWLYLGGPNCVHGWEEWVVRNRRTEGGDLIIDLIRVGPVAGLPGTPMRSRPLQGYRSEDSRAKSKRAYAIIRSQEGFNSTYMNDEQFSKCFGGVCDLQFNEQKSQVFAADQEKRMIYTPLMIPNILIPRFDEVSNEKYFVKFTPDSIRQIRDKFMIQLRGRMTNYEHSEKKFNDIVMVESWIVEGENDKAYQLGFTQEQVPSGTWMGAYKVLDTPEGDTVWNEYIKPGKVKGASVEGNFILNFSRQSKDDYLLSSIINILKQIDE